MKTKILKQDLFDSIQRAVMRYNQTHLMGERYGFETKMQYYPAVKGTCGVAVLWRSHMRNLFTRMNKEDITSSIKNAIEQYEELASEVRIILTHEGYKVENVTICGDYSNISFNRDLTLVMMTEIIINGLTMEEK